MKTDPDLFSAYQTEHFRSVFECTTKYLNKNKKNKHRYQGRKRPWVDPILPGRCCLALEIPCLRRVSVAMTDMRKQIERRSRRRALARTIIRRTTRDLRDERRSRRRALARTIIRRTTRDLRDERRSRRRALARTIIRRTTRDLRDERRSRRRALARTIIRRTTRDLRDERRSRRRALARTIIRRTTRDLRDERRSRRRALARTIIRRTTRDLRASILRTPTTISNRSQVCLLDSNFRSIRYVSGGDTHPSFRRVTTSNCYLLFEINISWQD